MPVIIDYKIYLNIEDLMAVGFPQRSIYNHISSKWLEVYNSIEHGKLIRFDSLRLDWRKNVNEFYDGCIKTYTQLINIEKALIPCPSKDKEFLMSLILPKGTHMDKKSRVVCEQKCQVLGFLSLLYPLTDGKIRQFGIKGLTEFWEIMALFVKRKGIKLPIKRRLSNLLKKYIEEGASAVISGKYGNGNSSKLGELERKLIVELYADRDGRKFTKKQVWEQFLFIANEKGWEHCKNVTYQIVAKVLRETRGEWHLERHGEKDFKLNQTVVINRRRPSGRNLVWQLDGTPECLWYYDAKRRTIDKLYVMKVMDSRTWKIVGYSIGYTETSNLVFECMKMACTLHGIKPKEVRSDKGSTMQSGETKELMRNLGATFYPTATGNARAKTIEAWQGLFNERVLTYFKNKSGANITAKSLNSRQNPDKLKANYKDYPTKEELVRQIRLTMELWNVMPNSKGDTPSELYEASEENGEPMSVLEQFELFAIWRKKGKKIQPYRYSIEGLKMEVSGQKYRYIPEVDATELANFMNRHTDVTNFYVKYDPSDLTQIALYELPYGLEDNANNMRFVCDAKLKGLTSETFQDATEAEKARLQKLRAVQKQQLQQAKHATDSRRALLAHQNTLNGAIELEHIHKDKLNQAELELQRLEMLGYNTEITSDKNKELSAISLMDEIDWTNRDEDSTDLNVYGLPKSVQ